MDKNILYLDRKKVLKELKETRDTLNRLEKFVQSIGIIQTYTTRIEVYEAILKGDYDR